MKVHYVSSTFLIAFERDCKSLESLQVGRLEGLTARMSSGRLELGELVEGGRS
jgi:hypothetical protein